MKNTQHILIKQKTGDLYIAAETIVYCESNNYYSKLKLEDGSVISYTKNLSALEVELPSFWFYRIHKSYIVNLKHISQFFNGEDAYVIISNDCKLPVAKGRRTGIIESFKQKEMILYRFSFEPVFVEENS